MSFSFDSPFVISAAAMSAALTLLKVTSVLLIALAVSALMRRRSAGARHLVWLVALIATLVLPLWSAWSPLPVRVLPPAAPSMIVTTTAETGEAKPPSIEVPNVSGERVAAAPMARPNGIGTLLLAVWALGVVVLLGRMALGALVVRGIVRRARVLEQPDWHQLYEIADRLGLGDAPRLVQSDRIRMPFATGFLKAVIVLPAESASWNSERRCAVLIHELAHVKRRDLVGHLVGGVACALYWFHPLVWKAAWHLRAESERACDDLALVLGTPAVDYAEHLLEIVTQVRDEHMPAIALAMAKPHEFEGRMLAILDPLRRRRAPGRAQAIALAGALTALALVVGAMAPMQRVAASTPRPNAPAPPALSDAPEASLELDKDQLTTKTISQSKSTRTQTQQQKQERTLTQTTTSEHSSQLAMVDDDDDADTDVKVTSGANATHRAEVLAKSLRTDTDAEVRRVAAWGLSRYAGKETAAKALADALARDASKQVREMSAWALGESRSPTAIAALEAAFLRDKSPEVKRTAAWAAGSVGSRSSVKGLTTLLADADPNVREVAAWSIGSCSPGAAPPALVRLLGDPDRDVRLAVAWALYEIADGSTADEIEAAFRREKDHEVQRGLIRALGSMGETSVETLTRLVDSPDPEIRAVAVAALAGGNISGPWPWPRPEPRPFP